MQQQPLFMQQWPLVVPHILDHAARWHGEQTVVCRTTEGPMTVSTYTEVQERARLCALALRALGVRCAMPCHTNFSQPPSLPASQTLPASQPAPGLRPILALSSPALPQQGPERGHAGLEHHAPP
jgi:hypothetical protein